MGNRNKTNNINIKALVTAVALVVLAVFASAALIGGCGSGNKEGSKVTAQEAAKARKKGLDLYMKGKLSEAVPELRKAAEGNPKDMQVQTELAYSYERQGKKDEAFKQYEQILKLDKNSADAHYGMGRILQQNQEIDKAIAEFEKAATMNIYFTAARVSLADAYTQAKEYSKALATYNELENLVKSDLIFSARVHAAKGNVYKLMGQNGNANTEFSKALQLDKNNKEAAAGLK